jgi:hypothetical protein
LITNHRIKDPKLQTIIKFTRDLENYKGKIPQSYLNNEFDNIKISNVKNEFEWLESINSILPETYEELISEEKTLILTTDNSTLEYLNELILKKYFPELKKNQIAPNVLLTVRKNNYPFYNGDNIIIDTIYDFGSKEIKSLKSLNINTQINESNNRIVNVTKCNNYFFLNELNEYLDYGYVASAYRRQGTEAENVIIILPVSGKHNSNSNSKLEYSKNRSPISPKVYNSMITRSKKKIHILGNLDDIENDFKEFRKEKEKSGNLKYQTRLSYLIEQVKENESSEKSRLFEKIIKNQLF